MSGRPGPLREETIGILFVIGTGLLIGVMDTVVKLLSPGYTVAMIVWARYTFHLVVLLPVLARDGPRLLVATRRPWLQLLRSTLMFATTALFFAALRLMPLADATAIMFAAPLIATALSVPILAERVGLHRWTSVIFGFAGVLIIIRPGMGVTGWAALLPLSAAICYGLYQITTRIIRRTDGPLTTLFYTALTGTVAMNIAIPFFWQTPALGDWPLLVVVGLLGGSSQYLFIKAYGHATPSLLAPFTYVQLIWVTILGLLVFGEFPDHWTITGALIIAGSGLYILHRERRAGPEPMV